MEVTASAGDVPTRRLFHRSGVSRGHWSHRVGEGHQIIAGLWAPRDAQQFPADGGGEPSRVVGAQVVGVRFADA